MRSIRSRNGAQISTGETTEIDRSRTEYARCGDTACSSLLANIFDGEVWIMKSAWNQMAISVYVGDLSGGSCPSVER
jgi:hypothetical protein